MVGKGVMMTELADLRRCSLAELEDHYRADHDLRVPTGRLRGELLRWVEGPLARDPLWRPFCMLAFQLSPFGIDFDRRCWFFWNSPRLAMGRFELRPGRSRWQPAETIGLHYEASRIPGLVRRHLYDEVKPLSADLCLGIGGINRPGGEGAIFYFALAR